MADSKEVLKRFSYSEGGAITAIVNLIYPVGCYYWSSNSTTPEELFGVGRWERVKGYYLFASYDKADRNGKYQSGDSFGSLEKYSLNINSNTVLTEKNIPKIDCGTFGVHRTRNSWEDIYPAMSGNFYIAGGWGDETNVDRGSRDGDWYKIGLVIGHDNPDPLNINVNGEMELDKISMPALCAYCWHRIE